MPWNIKNKNAALNSYVGEYVFICFLSVCWYVDGFEPLILQVNMMEISHSGIINHKLKAWLMKELNAEFKELNIYIYIHTHTHTHTLKYDILIFILVVSLVLCQGICICSNLQFSKILLSLRKPIGFVESQSPNEIIWHTIWDKVKFIVYVSKV